MFGAALLEVPFATHKVDALGYDFKEGASIPLWQNPSVFAVSAAAVCGFIFSPILFSTWTLPRLSVGANWTHALRGNPILIANLARSALFGLAGATMFQFWKTPMFPEGGK